jgi:hypothetical protein
MSDDLMVPFIPLWMEQAELTPHQYRVLGKLWSHGRGRCFPSVQNIAESCKINLKTAKRTLRELESMGFIERRKRKAAGVRFANEYILTGPKGAPVKLKQDQKEPHLTGPKETPPNRPISSPTKDTPGKDTPLKETHVGSPADLDLKLEGDPPAPVRGLRPDLAERVWNLTPAKGRERSSKKQLSDALRRLPKGIEDETIIAALEAWNRSEAWAKDSGRFVPGIHRWVNDRKWETAPEPASNRPTAAGDKLPPMSLEEAANLLGGRAPHRLEKAAREYPEPPMGKLPRL